MRLLKLQLQNFRNADRYELKLAEDKDVTVLVGDNGVGKTNILESIYMLATGKAFREADQNDLLKWGQDFFIIKGQAKAGTSEESTSDEIENLEVSYSNYPRKQKVFKINDVVKKHSEYLGNFIAVIFSPKDLNLIYLEPQSRRRYLNLLLAQVNKYYLEALSNYTKTHKQRNALLEDILSRISSQSELDVWDEKLAKEGAILALKRQEYVDFLNRKLQKIYREISGDKEEIKVVHECKIIEDQDKEKPLTEDVLKENFIRKLKLKRDKDIRFGSTSVGPHRDDIKFFLNGHPFESSASRGESRTLIIALKIAEMQFVEQKKKNLPIMLLDDVFSELDEKRQSHLLEIIQGCQTIITAAESSHVKAKNHSCKIVKI